MANAVAGRQAEAIALAGLDGEGKALPVGGHVDADTVGLPFGDQVERWIGRHGDGSAEACGELEPIHVVEPTDVAGATERTVQRAHGMGGFHGGTVIVVRHDVNDGRLQIQPFVVLLRGAVIERVGRVVQDVIELVLVQRSSGGERVRLPQQDAGPGHVRGGHARPGTVAEIVVDAVAVSCVVRHGAHNTTAWRRNHATDSLRETAERPVGVDRSDRHHVGAYRGIAQTRLGEIFKRIPGRDGREYSVGLQLGQHVLQGGPGGRCFEVVGTDDGHVHGGNRVLEGEPVVVNPPQGLFDSVPTASALLVEDAQGNQIDLRGHTRIVAVAAANDARHVAAMRAVISFVDGVRPVLREVPSTNDAIAGAEAAPQGIVVVGDSGIDDSHGLPDPGETIGTPNLVQSRQGVGGGCGRANLGVEGGFQ